MSAVPPPDLPSAEVDRLTLERYVLGRLGERERIALAGMAAGDPELAARIEKVGSEIREAAVGLPPLDLSLEPSAGADPLPRANQSWSRMVGALVAVAAVLGLVLLVPGEDPSAASDVVFRGAFDLDVVRIRHGEAQPQGVLVEARRGDRLQDQLTPGADGWLTVADVQDDGAVTLWLPPREVRAGERVEGAVALDGYMGKERVYFVLAEAPIEAAMVEQSVRSVFQQPLADLDALPGIAAAQRSLLIVKTD